MKRKAAKLRAADIDRFIKLYEQLQQLLARLVLLSHKAPDQAVNKFKIGIINEQLRIANGFLAESERPFAGFEQCDDVALPSNSDVVIVMSQYLACLEKWRSDRVYQTNYKWYWAVDNAEIEAKPPTIRGATED